MNEHVNRAKEEIERIFERSPIDSDMVVGNTYSTEEYGKFSFFETNRPIDMSHVKKLMAAAQDKGYLDQPILVTEDFKIIDGQHRFIAWSKLGLPINYTIGKEYGEKEIQMINNLSKSWTLNDFLNHFASKGIRHYELLKKFVEVHKVTLSVAGEFIRNPPYQTIVLKAGNFSNNDWGTTYEYMRKYQHLMNLCSFQVKFKHRTFLKALVSIFGNEDIDYKTFVRKCGSHGHLIKPQVSAENYLLDFEKMYNRNVMGKNKVRFFERKIGH